MVAETNLQRLLGLPALDEDLHKNVSIGAKATTGGSKIPPGKIIGNTAGVWAIAGAAFVGPMGILPKKFPLNEDADPTCQVADRNDTEWYIESGGVCIPGQRVKPGAGGVGVPWVSGTDTAQTAPFVYEGHEGEGVGLDNKPTNSAVGEPIRVRIVR
jgi:hypothetical protein